MPLSPRRRLLAVTAAVVTAAALTLTGGAVATAAPTDAFPGSVPAWATRAADAGVAPRLTTVEGEVFFDIRHPEAAERLALAVATPGNPRYGKPATPAAWIRRFAPKKSEFDEVLTFLKAAGLTITGTPKSRLFIVFRGTAAQLGGAFGTQLHRYRHGGRLLAAPSSAPRLPDSLSRGVLGVRLDEGRLLTRPTTAVPSGVRPSSLPADQVPVQIPTPCSKYYGQRTVTVPEAYGSTEYPTYLCGYTGTALRSAYGATASMTGAGQTVAVVDAYASPTIVDDVNTYSRRHGQPALTGFRQIVPKAFSDVEACGGRSGWQVEQTLDVEAVHNMAPKAQILYVGGSNCGGGLDLAVSEILDGGLANIVTNSYGYLGELPADAITAYRNQQLQAAAQGVGLYYSSGDDGDTAAITGVAQAGYPAASPYVTSVGGTTLGVAKDGSVALETGWGISFDPITADPETGATGYALDLPGQFVFGAGGGVSTVFAQPGYQSGVVPDDLAGGRAVSDLSADADPLTGQLVGVRELDDATGDITKYTEYPVGGTSLAAPLVAAQVALLQQRTGRTFGFLNPLLYSVAGSKALRDVRPVRTGIVGSSTADGISYLATTDTDSSLTTRQGYDSVTGLGSLRLGSAKVLAAAAHR